MNRNDALYVGLEHLGKMRGDPRWPLALDRLEDGPRQHVEKALSTWIGVRASLGLPAEMSPTTRLHLLPDLTAGIGFAEAPLWAGVVDEAWREANEIGVLKHLFEDDPAHAKSATIERLEPAALAWWLYKCQPEGVTVRLVFVRHGFERGIKHLEHRIEAASVDAWADGVISRLNEGRKE